MSTVIKVENLGKSYIIGHKPRESYTALRDVLANKARQLLRNGVQFVKGGQLISGNQLEEFWALKDVSFEVSQGDRIGIIGRNGAGKSTLLKVLSRITEPTTGRVELKGRVASMLEVGTGFHPELSGRENIFLNGAILGMSRAEVRSKFDEIVDFAGVEKFLDTPVKRYSSGMYVRLAFAVSAHLETEILVIDEVLAVGDTEFQKKCLGKMEDVSTKQGRTILFVSHNMASINRLCSKVMILNKGLIEYPIGEVNEAIQIYSSKASEPAKIDISERKDRSGEGNIRITCIEITDKENNISSPVYSGQHIKIRCHLRLYTNNIKSSILRIAISFTRSDGIFISYLDSELSGSEQIKFNSYDGIIECEITKLPLNHGIYLMNVSILADNIIQDYIKEVYSLEVHEGDYYGTGRITPVTHRGIMIEHKWNHY